MALAEPGRAEPGAGAIIAGYGHASMVFVHPDVGTGRRGILLQGLHQRLSARGWRRTTLWTRASNTRRFPPVPRPGIPSLRPRDQLGDGDLILQLVRQAH